MSYAADGRVLVEEPRAASRRVRVSVLVAVLLVVGGWPLAYDLWTRPIRSVLVAGEFQRVASETLQRVVAAETSAGFLGVDVDQVRAAALRLPWIRDVSVRRVWPDRLHIAVVEREAVVRWNDDALLEDDGARFSPGTLERVDGLPWLRGPEGRHAQVLERFRDFQRALDRSPLPPVRTLTLDDRGGWRIELADGAVLVLGHRRPLAALAAFAEASGAIVASRNAPIERVDLRYSNGFAIRWRAIGDSDGEPGAAEARPETTPRSETSR